MHFTGLLSLEPRSGQDIWPHWRNDSLHLPDTDSKACRDDFNNRIDCLKTTAGMAEHRVVSIGAFFDDHPEEVLERAFRFFDGFPEVPALLLLVSDGDRTRVMTGDMRRLSHCGDGPRRFGAMTESFAALLLARRDRVDTYLRPFAGSRETHLYKAGPPKPGFKPSRFIPEAWSAEQIDRFDDLPTIAVLHRPIRVGYRSGAEDKPITDSAEQAELMPLKKKTSRLQGGIRRSVAKNSR